MLLRIVRGSLMRRRRRKLLALTAVALGIAAATTLGTIELDVGDKVSRELRSYGANISVVPAAGSLAVTVGGVEFSPGAGSGASLAEASLVNLKRIFWRNNILAFAPFLEVPVEVRAPNEPKTGEVPPHTSSRPARQGGLGSERSRSVMLAGTWIDHDLRVDASEVFRTGVRKLHPGWKVTGEWPSDGDARGCLLGWRLARLWSTRLGESVAVVGRSSQAGPVTLTIRGILETGGAEDDLVIVPLSTAQKLAGLEGRVGRVEVSALTKPEDSFGRSDPSKLSPQDFDRWFCTPYVRSIAYQIDQVVSGAEARPIYRVAETEGKVLDRIGALMALLAVAALATAALAVASMMLASVLERRVEIGLFKSLGATDAHVAAIFFSEALALAVLGGMIGYGAGSLLARVLALAVFGTAVGAHGVIFPAALALAVIVTAAGCAVPLATGLKISPARVLRE